MFEERHFPLGREVGRMKRTETLDGASPCADITASLRIGKHLKENNLTYLVGLLAAMQLGILDKLISYGGGVCG